LRRQQVPRAAPRGMAGAARGKRWQMRRNPGGKKRRKRRGGGARQAAEVGNGGSRNGGARQRRTRTMALARGGAKQAKRYDSAIKEVHGGRQQDRETRSR